MNKENTDKSKLGTIVDGIAASEHLDSSGEILDIEGMDISSLGSADSILNFEHNSKDNPSQVCGKVTFAKKIFKKADCSNEREEYFWNISKKPFVYIKGELFDHPDLDHDGARNVAALLRYDNRDKGKKARRLISFSIEGGKIEKKGMNVKKSIARDCALTIKHCNKMCIAEILDDIKDRKDLYKNETPEISKMQKSDNPVFTGVRSLILNHIKTNKKENKQEETSSPMGEGEEIERTREVERILKNYDTENKMRKALIAGMNVGSPDSRTGTACLTPEYLEGKLEKPFSSKAQRRFAHANPEKFGGKEGIKEWESKTPKDIPEKVKKNQPDLSFSKLGHENISRQNVKQVDDPYAATSAYISRYGKPEGTASERKKQIKEKVVASNAALDYRKIEDKEKYSTPTKTQIEPTQVENEGNKNKKKSLKPDTLRGFAVRDSEKQKSKAFSFAPTSDREKMSQATKRGSIRGEFDTTTQHESLHDHLNNLQFKFPTKNDEEKEAMRYSLVRHSLSHFPSNAIKAVQSYLKKPTSSYKNRNFNVINEETLAYLSDFRSNPDKRESVYRHLGISEDPEAKMALQDQVKKGWKKLMHPENPLGSKNLTWDKLKEIHDNYKKQEQQKTSESVPIQRIPPGVSGIKD